MTILHVYRVTCPACATRFATLSATGYTLGARDTDGRPEVADDPLPYFVHLCPECGQAGHIDDFESIDHAETLAPDAHPAVHLPVQQRTVDGEALKWPHGSLFQPPYREAAYRYRMAAQSFRSKGRKTDAARSLLRASWCARKAKLASLERECQGDARALFVAVADDATLDAETRNDAAFLVAELSRRLADFGEAARGFAAILKREPDHVVVVELFKAAQQHDAENKVIGELAHPAR